MEFSAATILRIITVLYLSIFSYYYFADLWAHRAELSRKHFMPLAITGFITNALDVLGIGSFATTQSCLKISKASPDDVMPGTLNVAFTIPVALEFFLFLGLVEVDTLTLVLMIVSAALGAVLGAKIVSKWPVNVVRLGLGVALILLAIMMSARQLQIGPFGAMGTATGLTGISLAIGVAVNFVLGALMMIGVGLYAPCMALVSALGMNVSVAFPIMMGSCAFLMPSGALTFIKTGKYDRWGALILTISACVGVLLAYYIIKSLPLETLTWVVICVMLYTSIRFFMDAFAAKKTGETA